MSLRLLQTNRKEYKTQINVDQNEFPFLTWKLYPSSKDLSNIDSPFIEGVRVWLAGTSLGDKWFIKRKHLPGEYMFPEGGYTLESPQEGITYVNYQEVILHPSFDKKPKQKKQNEKPLNSKTKRTKRKRS